MAWTRGLQELRSQTWLPRHVPPRPVMRPSLVTQDAYVHTCNLDTCGDTRQKMTRFCGICVFAAGYDYLMCSSPASSLEKTSGGTMHLDASRDSCLHWPIYTPSHRLVTTGVLGIMLCAPLNLMHQRSIVGEQLTRGPTTYVETGGPMYKYEHEAEGLSCCCISRSRSPSTITGCEPLAFLQISVGKGTLGRQQIAGLGGTRLVLSGGRNSSGNLAFIEMTAKCYYYLRVPGRCHSMSHRSGLGCDETLVAHC
ncbi:hypothetical protein J3F83DRAFT_94536 [Trichoderma novae-zelandiae]